MIIVRAPLRITLGGGGTDVASYYTKHGGLTIAAAIDRYVYITVNETFVDNLLVRYSEIERVTSLEDIRHPIIREVLSALKVPASRLEIVSMADIPAGTGLGSSSAFTVALIMSLYAQLEHAEYSTENLAEFACNIEIDRLHEPIGKQDQYIAAFGGICSLRFSHSGNVAVSSSLLSTTVRNDLEDGLALYFTGYQRSAAQVLSETNGSVDDNLQRIHEIAFRTQEALESGQLDEFAKALNRQWHLKRERLPLASNSQIDEWYAAGMNSGALGGKLIGAGGGGFLMFFAENKRRLRSAMTSIGLPEVRFRFDDQGAQAILR